MGNRLSVGKNPAAGNNYFMEASPGHVVSLGSPFIVFITPSTTGVTFNGSSVTISDLNGGFGTKATAAPLFYSNFDSATVGAAPSSVGLVDSQDSTVVSIQNDKSFTGTKSLKVAYSPSVDNFPEISLIPPANTTSCYIFGMVYWTETGTNSPVFKWSRIGAGQLYHGTPGFYQTCRPDPTGTITSGDWGFNTVGSGVAWCQDMYNLVNTRGNPLPGPTKNQWNAVEYSYIMSNPSGATNGLCRMFNNGQDMFPPPYVNQNTGASIATGETNNSGSNQTIAWIIPFIDGLSSGSAAANGGNGNSISMWVDELYIDTTLSRVILTDNILYNNSTIFLPQPPTSWSDTQIIATLNRAPFTSGAQGYFHIFNSLGAEVIVLSATLP